MEFAKRSRERLVTARLQSSHGMHMDMHTPACGCGCVRLAPGCTVAPRVLVGRVAVGRAGGISCESSLGGEWSWWINKVPHQTR